MLLKELAQIVNCDGVYPVSDDTHLLLEAALHEYRLLAEGENRNVRVLEIGAGTGYVSIALAILGAQVVATDISLVAVNCVSLNARRVGVKINALHGDLFEPVRGEKFDLILFNPPYLEPDDELDRTLEPHEYLSVVGGRKLIIRFLSELNKHLTARGRAILIAPEQTIMSLWRESIASRRAFKILYRRALPYETLVAVRITCPGIVGRNRKNLNTSDVVA